MQYKEWQKPITTRRYLHAPLAERVATLWSEGKIVLGEVETLEGPRMPEYETLVSCGVWPVFGKEMESLDFKKTENIMMNAVKRGGDRQELHELIRTYSMEAGKRVKLEGRENNLPELIAADSTFGLTLEEINAIMLPENFVGRAPEQTVDFINENVKPVLEENKELLGLEVEINV